MAEQDSERGVMLSVLAGIGIGVIVGAIAGLLMAPKSGNETRQDIGATLGDLGTKLTDLSQQVASRVKTVVETGQKVVGDAVEGVTAIAEESTETPA